MKSKIKRKGFQKGSYYNPQWHKLGFQSQEEYDDWCKNEAFETSLYLEQELL